MSNFRTLRNFILTTFIILISAVGYAGYIALSNIVADQSRIQQESMSPMFSLMTEEVIQPLHIALTISRGDFLLSLLDEKELDKETVVNQLKSLEQEFGLTFFIASENTRVQYMSDGRELNLIKGEVYWYFEALEQEKDILADLGQVGDVHLFYDIKLYNKSNDFIGIVGVGKSLKEFLKRFDEFRNLYGYNFLFLNEKNDIILTSEADLATVDAHIPNLNELAWYDALDKSSLVDDSLNGVVISESGAQYLLSEFYIEQLSWRLLLMIPLDARQTQLTTSFVQNLLMVGVIFALLLISLFTTANYLRKRVERSIESDVLTGLGNRNSIHRHFSRLERKKTSKCLVILDVDHFKSVNDTYGHDTGDEVLRQVAQTIKNNIREQDILARWGGEEFVMILPGADLGTGERVAEHVRKSIESLVVTSDNKEIQVTASFGVHACESQSPLNELIKKADTALYIAKENGRNRVEISPVDE